MKRSYTKPYMEVTEFRFAEHIAASGTPTSSCYWGGGATWTHGYSGCKDVYNAGTEGWIGLNG